MRVDPADVTLYQVYVNGAVPLAVTESVVDCPDVIVWLAGCAVIPGAVHVPVVVPLPYTAASASRSHAAGFAPCVPRSVAYITASLLAGVPSFEWRKPIVCPTSCVTASSNACADIDRPDLM